jgi:Tol biopolymer transport system component
MSADGSHIRPLTPPDLLANTADWSPDGRRIVFATNGQEGVLNEEIWVINADGSRLVQLTNNPGLHDTPFARRDFAPSWSPQGDAIAFERDNGDFSEFGIYVLNLNGSGERLSRRGGFRSSINRMNSMRSARRRTKHTQKLVEPDGFFPRWGSAQ